MGLYDDKTRKTTLAQSLLEGKQSFEDIGCNLSTIAERLMGNEDLMKLLIHTSKDAEELPLTEEQIQNAFGDQIRIVPAIRKDEGIKNYVIVQFGGFAPVPKTDYKSYIITFDIICNIDNWMMKDYTPRPYKIMSQVNKLMNQTKIDSLGPVSFLGAQNLVINEELSGFTLSYGVMTEM